MTWIRIKPTEKLEHSNSIKSCHGFDATFKPNIYSSNCTYSVWFGTGFQYIYIYCWNVFYLVSIGRLFLPTERVLDYVTELIACDIIYAVQSKRKFIGFLYVCHVFYAGLGFYALRKISAHSHSKSIEAQVPTFRYQDIF